MSQYNDYYANKGEGGGFMASPGGFDSPSSAARRQNAQQALRPVTISQLARASQAHADAEFRIDDMEIGQITLVGQVMQVKNQATNSTYVLDDGTGRFEARHWNDANAGEDERGIKENAYMRVMGTLKSFGGRTYINATHIRPCKDKHEQDFHVLEAMTVTLTLQRGPPGQQQNGHASIQQAGANGSSAYTVQASTNGTNDQWAFLPELQRKIVHFILSQPNHTDGVHVSAVARAIGQDAQGISLALDQLMDEGHVYTTSDESHFDVSV
ncbi:replication protein A subunit [Phanerochaete sordida]|uniref:Replication protein A subunit n=1 Tax=Phanerochaete sordida TaxID=48140 RepID=A0A9P3LAM8_9APHY|nr:replication protein A subunit [Phanerochaete sordida]